MIPLLVVLLGVALGVGGVLLLRPFGVFSVVRASSLTGHSAARPLNAQAIYKRLEPSIVDVTATLRYEDETASGTGFVVDGRASLVLTNNHVIREATSVTVRLTSTGKNYPAKVVGVDVGADIALLQLQGAARLTAAPLGDSASVALGTPVLAIGNQAGQGGSPTIAPGVIDSLNRTIQANDGASGFTETLHGMLQTSARIEPGDSGGPLADATGAVVGVDTAAGTGTAAVGYAIPIDGAMAVARQIATRHPAPGIVIGTDGFLGVVVPATARDTHRLREQGGKSRAAGRSAQPPGCLDTEAEAGLPPAIAPARAGALVEGVLCGTGAAAAGIAAGDVITAAAGQPVTSSDALTAITKACRPGTLVRVTWVTTAGATRTALVLIDAAPVTLSLCIPEQNVIYWTRRHIDPCRRVEVGVTG
jgi:S1-C subfamily serine protease